MTTDNLEQHIAAYAALGIPRGIALTMLIYEQRRRMRAAHAATDTTRTEQRDMAQQREEDND